MHTIIFEYDENGVVAKLEDNPEFWGHGRSEQDAVGRLIWNHPNLFQLNPIEVEE